MSLRDEVAKCVRVKLAKQPSQPMTAESFGSVWNMQRAGNGAHHYEGSGGQSFIQAKGLVDSADAVRSSPHAVHFVAHLPEQLTPQEFNRYDGTRGVIIHAPGSPDGIEDLRTGASQNARAQAANQNVNEGQRRIRQLLGIQGDLPGRSPTVYFKSHRAAQLMAAATGGHVESVAIKPNAIARRVKVTQTPGYVERSPFMGIFDARSGAHSDQLTERMLPATDRRADQAPFVISQHPVIGEYMTLMGQRSVDPDNSWTVLDELNPHRGAVLQENGWQPNADVRHFYGDPPRHDHIAQLGQTAAQLHQQYLANPDDHLARAVLADHLEEIGQHELAGAFYASLPQQFSRRGDKLRLSAAVAEHVRVKLSRDPGDSAAPEAPPSGPAPAPRARAPRPPKVSPLDAPTTADSFGGKKRMRFSWNDWRANTAYGGGWSMGNTFSFQNQPNYRGEETDNTRVYDGFAIPPEQVQSSDKTVHFVAFHPRQVSAVNYHWNKATGAYNKSVKLIREDATPNQPHPAHEPPLENHTIIGGIGNEAHPIISQIEQGQARVRALLRLPPNSPGIHSTVYFKSHRAAELMARAVGGRVETAAYAPHILGRDLDAHPEMDKRRIAPKWTKRGGFDPAPWDNHALYADGEYASTILADHPAFGEYIADIGAGEVSDYDDNPYEAIDASLSHRGSEVRKHGSFYRERLRELAEHAARTQGYPIDQIAGLAGNHDIFAQADPTTKQLYQAFLANPGDHLGRAVLADHLEESGQLDMATAFRASVPQQFSRHGEKLRLSAAVAERVRVQLARKAGQPMTADSLGGTAEMKAAGQGEYDNSYGIPFASSPSAEEVRKSPHVLHFVAHHPLQAAPPRIGNLVTPRAPIFDLQAPGGIGRYLPTDDPSSEAIRQGQEAVRSLLGLHSHRGDTPTVFFKSYKGARLAAALTGGHVDSIALRPAGLARYIERTRKAVNRAVKMDNSHELMDEPLAIIDLRPEPDGSPGKIAKALGSMPSQPDFVRDIHTANYGAFGDERDMEYLYDDPWVINRHDVFGEYITNPYGNAARDLPTDVALPHTAHRASIHHHAGIVPNSDGFTPIANPEAETAFHRLNREYPSAAHPLWHQGHSVPGQHMPITPEEAAEMAREHWATLLEHASAERPLVLAGMHVPTRQHIEALGPDAQHLWALQRDPVARLALGDMLEERGHDEMAHFMRATVPLQYQKTSGVVRYAAGEQPATPWTPRSGENVLYHSRFDNRQHPAVYHDANGPDGYHEVVKTGETGGTYAHLNELAPIPKYRDGDRVTIFNELGGEVLAHGRYRRKSLTTPGHHEIDVQSGYNPTQRYTLPIHHFAPFSPNAIAIGGAPQPPPASMDENLASIAEMLSGPGGRRPASQAANEPQPFNEPHDLRAGDVIRIFNADDGSPIAHAREGGDRGHDVHGYELINQHERDTPFAAGPSTAILPTVRTIPLGPRNLGRNPFILDTRGRMFQVLRRSEGPRDRSYVDSYGHTFYHGDVLHIDGEPHTVVRNLTGSLQPGVELIRQSNGRERFLEGRQDASGAYRIFDEHVRRIGDGEQATPAAPQDSVQQTASQGPPPPTVPLEIMLHDHHSTTTGSEQANRLRAMFEAIHGSPVDDETIMHILRVPRPFAGADPHHEIFHPKNIRLRVTIGNDFVHAHVDSRLRSYSFQAGTDFSGGKVYNATQFHDGWHRDVRVPGEPVKLISTPHILQNQARAAHALGMPELKVTAGQMNPHRPGGMTGGLVWPMYGYTARLSDKYGTAHLDEAAQIIRRNDPSKQHVDSNDLWLHDLLSSNEGRAWYTEARPQNDATYYPHVISGSMRFRTHPDSESHKLLSAHTAKVEGHAARKSDPAPEA